MINPKINNDVLDWYQSYCKLDQQTLDRFQSSDMTKYVGDNIDYQDVCRQLNEHLICQDQQIYYDLWTDVSATEIIRKIRNQLVDDDTLVVTTTNEHGNVVKIFADCENICKYSIKDLITRKQSVLKQIVNKFKTGEYKRIFVYTISMTNYGDCETPVSFLTDLKQILADNNIESSFVLDDCQGMFIMPKPYHIFDYIIHTAHTISEIFETGFLFVKPGCKVPNMLSRNSQHCCEFLWRLNVVCSLKPKLYIVSYVIQRWINDNGLSDKIHIIHSYSPNRIVLNVNTVVPFEIIKDPLIYDHEVNTVQRKLSNGEITELLTMSHGCENNTVIQIRSTDLIGAESDLKLFLTELFNYLQILSML